MNYSPVLLVSNSIYKCSCIDVVTSDDVFVSDTIEHCKLTYSKFRKVVIELIEPHCRNDYKTPQFSPKSFLLNSFVT